SLRGPGVHGRGRELTGACKRRDVEFATLRPGTRPCRAGRGLDRPAFVRGQTEPRGPVLWSGLVPAGPLSMGTYALGSVFSPASVALVGGSPRERSLGRLVLRQLVEGGFPGRIGVVNRRYPEIAGVPTAPSLAELGFAPELVLIATPPATVARVARRAADAGARALIVLTRDMGKGPESHNAALAAIARERGLRVLGPNCLGVIAPHSRLHASFAAHRPPPGDLALVSQSGSVGAAMIEWASQRGLGFSAVVSL